MRSRPAQAHEALAHLPLPQQRDHPVDLGLERARASRGRSRPVGRSCGEGARETSGGKRGSSSRHLRLALAEQAAERARQELARVARERGHGLGRPGRGRRGERRAGGRPRAGARASRPHFTIRALSETLPSFVSSRKSTAAAPFSVRMPLGLLADQLAEALERRAPAPRRPAAAPRRSARRARGSAAVSRARVARPGTRPRRRGRPGRGGGRGRARGRRRRQLLGPQAVQAEGLALLARAQLLLPQLVEGRVARGQALVAEALAVVADLGVGVAPDERLDLRLQLRRRLLLRRR